MADPLTFPHNSLRNIIPLDELDPDILVDEWERARDGFRFTITDGGEISRYDFVRFMLLDSEIHRRVGAGVLDPDALRHSADDTHPDLRDYDTRVNVANDDADVDDDTDDPETMGEPLEPLDDAATETSLADAIERLGEREKGYGRDADEPARD